MDIVTLALAKQYTDTSLAGGGAIQGKNCTVDSITTITGGHRVTFKWTLDNGTEETGYMDVMDGEKGDQGIQGIQGVGIAGVTVNSNNHLIVTYEDGNSEDAGQIIVTTATFGGMLDVNFTDLANGQIAKYNAETHKWENTDESGGSSWTDYTGTLTAGQTSITIPCELSSDVDINVYTSAIGVDYNSLTISGYSYSEFMDGKIVVRENLSDNTDIKLFVCGLTKESSDITISDNDLLAYLSDITDGYLKACETFDTADSTTQTGILAFSNNSGTMLLRTYVPGWLQYKAGTFYGVIDLNEAPVAAQGAPAYQENEYSDPYIGTSSVILTFDEQQTDLGVKVRVS